jgi:hypothetical protein
VKNMRIMRSLIVPAILALFSGVVLDTGLRANPDTVMHVQVKEGLRMRALPDVKSEKICVIPEGATVNVLEVAGAEQEISGARGKWHRVLWNGKSGWVFGGFLAEGPGADRAVGNDDISEDEIIGTSCYWVLTPDEGMDGMDFKINADKTFEAECLQGGGGKATLKGACRVVKEKNRLHIFVSGTNNGFYVSDKEERWSKKFAGGEIWIWKKGGVFFGTSKNLPNCLDFTNREITVKPQGK